MQDARDDTAAFARVMTDIGDALTEHFAESPDDMFGAIEKIYAACATPAIRFVQGFSSNTSSLPAVFQASCGRMPGCFEDYVVDSLRHDDTGVDDIDLVDMSVTTFTKNFFVKIKKGQVGELDLEKDFILPIARILDPDAAEFGSMALVFLDDTRLRLHRVYCGRLLHCIGKPVDVPGAYGTFIDECGARMTSAKQGGCHLADDCAVACSVIYAAVMRTGGAALESCLKTGGPWSTAFVDRSIHEFKAFDKWATDAVFMKSIARGFKRTIQSMVPAGNAATQPRNTAPRGGLGGGLGGGGGGRGTGGRGAGALGSRAGNVTRGTGTWDGWYAYNPYGEQWFHRAQACTLIESTTGLQNQCVEVVVSTGGGASGWTLQFAEQFCCDTQHRPNDPAHAAFGRQRDILAAMQDDVHRAKRPGLRAAAVAAGDDSARRAPRESGRGSGGGGRGDGGGGGRGDGGRGRRGRGPFRGRAARQ